jgi:Fe2+ transport system protein FeoA
MKQNDLPAEPLSNHVIKNTDTARQVVASINLTQIENGRSAKVLKLQGGHQVVGKLEAMGVVPGTIIVKKTAALMKGPIVIEKGVMQFAIGYGMAQGIVVEPIDED